MSGYRMPAEGAHQPTEDIPFPPSAPESGADVTVTAKVGAVDDDALRIDLTVASGETTVLGKAQVRVRRGA